MYYLHSLSCYLSVPGAALAGLVAPSMDLAMATAPRPSHTMATTGPDLMYSISPGKKGRSCTRMSLVDSNLL